ncbi:MAG: glutamine--fructose-6-phosphate transaminase (isomerizing) [Planctomycetota bacterium]|nr:glutamine--fructose-6-phosphate transaminase (isomerizing) [Planctomycetota bacterium]
MCGIVGYIGKKKRATQVLLKGLERLEYRGYDSAGVAVVEDGTLYSRKRTGRVFELAEVLSKEDYQASAGIGHTRWATHGKPSEENAHPHFNTKNTIAVVHNGIIENNDKLREELKSRGTVFRSQTDTEVIPHLIDQYIHIGVEDAVRKAVEKLDGAYALVVTTEKEPDKLVVVRKGSPIVLGIGNGEHFVASSVEAIQPFADKVVYLEDGHWATLYKDRLEVFDNNGNPIRPDVHKIDWEMVDAELGPYAHFMLKEIHEQADVMRRIVGDRISDNLPFFEEMTLDNSELAAIDRVVVQACGTSWHAGLVGKYYLERFAGVHADVEISSEFRYCDPILDTKSLVMAISQSGETADALEGIRLARKQSVRTLSIVNVMKSTIARESHQAIYMRAGTEVGVASTKAFTAEIALLLMLSLHLGRIRWRLQEDRIAHYMDELRKLPTALEVLLSETEKIAEVAKDIQDSESAFFIGRGLSYPIALEGALKLKEISYIHAAGYPAGELKHGPIALIEEGTPVVFICPNDPVAQKTLSNAQEVRSRGAKVIGVVEEGFEEAHAVCDHVLTFPSIDPAVSPLLSIVPLQLLAYHVAVLRGCDVDKPRNLAKSVTVE